MQFSGWLTLFIALALWVGTFAALGKFIATETGKPDGVAKTIIVGFMATFSIWVALGVLVWYVLIVIGVAPSR